MSKESLPVPVNLLDFNTGQNQVWEELNSIAGGHPDFYPLTIKAGYVIGIIYDICQAAETLVINHSVKYLAGFGVFSSAMELLGRCLLGIKEVRRHSGVCLRAGFRWLVKSDIEEEDNLMIVTKTPKMEYSIENLVSLRNFAAHGQTTGKNVVWDLDPYLMINFPQLIGRGIDHYWNGLTGKNGKELQQTLCDRLADANIIAIHRAQPINRVWSTFSSGSAGDEFRALNYSLIK